jgi:hypothetical protein
MSALAAEFDGIALGDQRLNRRARRRVTKLGEKPTLSIPAACGGWRETRAAYRLFDHAAVTAEAVLAPHIACTVERMGARPRALCIEDTSEIDYTGRTMLGRECPEMPCDVVFHQDEWHTAYIVNERKPPPDTPPTLDRMVRMVAGLGGFLGHTSDAFPGPQTLWIGLQRAADFVLAMEAQRGVGEGRYG